MAAVGLAAAPVRRLEIDNLLERFGSSRWTVEHRLYRVDAALTVLSSPLHWFRDIGAGFLSVSETTDRRASVLRFGASSSPEKAKGFDRLGFIEEAAAGGEFASFGFITSGHEAHSATTAQAGYTAMDLYARGAQCWFRRAGVAAVQQSRRDLNGLIGTIRGRLPQSDVSPQLVQLAGPHPTFLHALRNAVNGQTPRFQCTYVYNAKQFDLTIVRQRDPHTAAQLASRGLTHRPETIERYDGEIRDGAGQTTNRQWTFHFWLEQGTGARLPLRIEFQAKSLLRLGLELAQPARSTT